MLDKLKYWLGFIKSYKNWPRLALDRLLQIDSNSIFLRNGLKIFAAKNHSLTVVADEIFVLERYTPAFLKIKRGDIVVDIGAHVGVFSLFAVSNGASRVFSYEPDINTFRMLGKNIKLNKIKNIKPFNLAVVNIKDFINRVKKIDFLKIDCEGCEGQILKSAGKDDLKKIKKIAMEYHDNTSSLSHKRMVRILESSGFITKKFATGGGFGYIYARRKIDHGS